jgi:hypothetical protein
MINGTIVDNIYKKKEKKKRKRENICEYLLQAIQI